MKRRKTVHRKKRAPATCPASSRVKPSASGAGRIGDVLMIVYLRKKDGIVYYHPFKGRRLPVATYDRSRRRVVLSPVKMRAVD
jgi:hypothetical protein